MNKHKEVLDETIKETGQYINTKRLNEYREVWRAAMTRPAFGKNTSDF